MLVVLLRKGLGAMEWIWMKPPVSPSSSSAGTDLTEPEATRKSPPATATKPSFGSGTSHWPQLFHPHATMEPSSFSPRLWLPFSLLEPPRNPRSVQVHRTGHNEAIQSVLVVLLPRPRWSRLPSDRGCSHNSPRNRHETFVRFRNIALAGVCSIPMPRWTRLTSAPGCDNSSRDSDKTLVWVPEHRTGRSCSFPMPRWSRLLSGPGCGNLPCTATKSLVGLGDVALAVVVGPQATMTRLPLYRGCDCFPRQPPRNRCR